MTEGRPGAGLGMARRLVPRGFTLLELLVVMAIMAVLGTLTAAAFVGISRRASREGAAEDVMGLLRQARVSAISSGRGALVRINPAEGSLYGVASKVVAAWHFEQVDGGETPGARRMNASTVGDPAVAPGVEGLCLEFDGADDAVNCGQYPVYDQTDGIRLEAYVYPVGADPSGMAGVMAKLDEHDRRGYALWLNRVSVTGAGTFAVKARVYVNDETNAVAASDKWRLDLDSGDVLIQGSKWSHVAFEYDGFEARLYVNDVLADLDSYRASEAGNIVPDPNPLTDRGFEDDPPALIMPARGGALYDNLLIGAVYDGMSYHDFQGRIDEPRVLSVAGGQRYSVPERVPMLATEPVLHFDDEGQLDIAYHAGPVYVALGDPFQMAELTANLASGVTAFTVGPTNPFPPAGGVLMVGEELIHYQSATDLMVVPNERGYLTTADTPHFAGDPVYFARVIEVPTTGFAQRAE
ncbi:MAG: hypothetical protein AMK73_01125 [Planctomycetes bacterium SM23_32]|nr:MAG: hypothetical protein AMK73_01125 [Planctomycetes bacterium SM23_32]